MMFFLSSRKQRSKQVVSLSLDSSSDGGCDDCNNLSDRRRRRNCKRNRSCSSGSGRTTNRRNHQHEIIISPPITEKFDQVGWENIPVVIVNDSLSATPIPLPPSQVASQSGLSSSLQATTPQKKTSKKKKKKKVQFITVQVREHALTVGEHDWCDGRLPLSLDWRHARSNVYHVDYYESLRDRKGRLPKGQLRKLDYYQRQQRLRRVSGYTTHELEVLEQQAAQRFQQQQKQQRGSDNQQQNLLRKSKTVTFFARDEDDSNTASNNNINSDKKNSDQGFVPLNYFGNLEESTQ